MRTRSLLRLSLALLLLCLSTLAQSAALLTIPAVFARDHAWFDDRTLAISIPGGLLRYDVETGQSLGTLAFGVQPYFVDLSPDGTRLAVADWNRFDSETQFHIVTTANGAVQTLRFARASQFEEGTYSLAWVDNQTLRITSEGNGQQPIRLFDTQSQSLTTVGSINHGALLAPSADRSVIAQLTTNQTPGFVQFLAGNTVVAANQGTPVGLFDIAVSPNGAKFLLPFNGSGPAGLYRRVGADFQLSAWIGDLDSEGRKIRAMRYLPTRPYAISADSSQGSGPLPPGVTLRNAASLRVITVLDAYAYGTAVVPDRQGRISVSPNEQRIAVTTLDEVRVYDISEFLFHDDFDALD